MSKMSSYLLRVFRGFKVKVGSRTEDRLLSFLVRELNRRWDSDVPLEEQVYVAFDLETTGLHPFGGDRIIALGAARLENGMITGGFEQLVNPGREIPPVTAALTGITDAEVADAPAVEEVLPAFLDFLLQGVPLGFNADFDLSFLNLVLRLFAGSKIARTAVVDVLTVVQALHPQWEHCLLDDAARYYGVPLEGRHSARGDAVIHARLYWSLLPVLAQRGVYTLKDLRGYLCFRSLL